MQLDFLSVTLLLTSCVTLGRLLHCSVPPFPHLQISCSEDKKVSTKYLKTESAGRDHHWATALAVEKGIIEVPKRSSNG